MLSTAGLTSNLAREHAFEPLTVRGTLPVGLRGTLYRNGPGMMERFGRRYDHLFEGDGAVTALRIEEGRAFGASRVLRTAGFVAEEAARRHLGSFAAPWLTRLRAMHGGTFKNTANTSVLGWQNRLFALMEGGLPTEIDPDSLDTLGTTTLDAVIDGAFTAHPHYVAARRCTYAFGLRFGRQTTLELYALPDDGAASRLGAVPLADPVMLHDFVATERHLVFFVSPLVVRTWRMMLALGPFQHNFAWQPERGTEVIVVPIDTPDQVHRFRVPAFFQWHFANAFDAGGTVVVDYVREDAPASFQTMGSLEEVSFTNPRIVSGGRLHRARIDLSAQTLDTEPLGEVPCEFPMVDRRFGGTEAPETFVQIERFEGSTVRFGVARVHDGAWTCRWLDEGEHCGEPILTRDHLIVLVYDGRTTRSTWQVLDRDTLGTVAEVVLPQAIPVTFHGTWVPG